MSNFQFIQAEWPSFFEDASEAEALVGRHPKASAVLCRSALEIGVNWIFQNDADLELPYDTRLSSLMYAEDFQNILKPSLWRELNLIRKTGNVAAHGKRVKEDEAVIAIKNLYRFASFLQLYYGSTPDKPPVFSDDLLEKIGKDNKLEPSLEAVTAELEKKNEKLQAELKKLKEKLDSDKEFKEKREQVQKQNKEKRKEREQTVNFENTVPSLLSEKETRERFIDLNLSESGWSDLKEGYNLEYEVVGMPITTNPSGKGKVDYVLWGNDGKPLALVEAKKTMADARKGKHQSVLYADCLEKMHGQRPLIFYSNGFENYFWDDTFYPDREVSGFFTKDEMQLMINRRKSRKDLRSFQPNLDIAERYYQLKAIGAVADRFCKTDIKGNISGGPRKALLVMATGSGKTRTAISIVDMLTKSNWAKRVLFLADRNALLRQAKNSFNEHLPHLSAIDLTREKEDNGTRLVFSTYATIINKIDESRIDDERFYSPGHFDLIVIDEAHRSVYLKYRAIFEYFDSLLLGLTATPKSEIDRNTFELFNIEDKNPTFAYELTQAVKDKYLVPYKAIKVPLQLPSSGIHYKDLSEEEKEEYEAKFGDPSQPDVPDFISGQVINQWLFNRSTVDEVLKYLMERGIKVEGGDKLGKTIIFAKNHKHAEYIEERFDILFPEYRGHFLRVIDNYESKAEDLLVRFCDNTEEKDPQIAVSVDMMDTGVDAPRVVNLVFFKPVRSLTKFWQMIGRGTRLREVLFGPGQDKSHFLIFDFCNNFEFFDEQPEGIEGSVGVSISQRIFELKADLFFQLQLKSNRIAAENELLVSYYQQLHETVKAFNHDRFQVKARMKWVLKYSEESAWESLKRSDLNEINENLSPLCLPLRQDHELARRFDVMLFKMIHAEFNQTPNFSLREKLVGTSKQLLKKTNIPQVAAHKEKLEKIIEENFFDDCSILDLEEVRIEIRELVKFLDPNHQEMIYTNFIDKIEDEEEVDFSEDEQGSYSNPEGHYFHRLNRIIQEHKDHIVIHKIKSNEPITKEELAELERILFKDLEVEEIEGMKTLMGDKPLGIFIRSLIGLEIKAANKAFADLIYNSNLKPEQLEFIQQIISFLNTNGYMDPAMLFESPFTDLNDQGISGVFEDAEAHRVISILNKIDENAKGNVAS